MIDLYTSPTPNGHKISCALEAMDLDYNAILVNLMEGEQHKPDFLEISPNGKIPAIIDQENGFKLAESGAILIYCLLYTSPSPRDAHKSRMPSSA